MYIGTSKGSAPYTFQEEHARKLEPFLEKLRRVAQNKNYSDPECSIRLPFDEAILENVEAIYAKTTHPKLKYIVVIGIGGSNLGAKALYDALWGYHDTAEPLRTPKIIWLDTSDEIYLDKVTALLGKLSQPEEAVIIQISKSGSTSETAENGSRIWNMFGKDSTFTRKRWVVITDKGSPLSAWAAEEDLYRLEIPKNVGGRFSVFAASGLLPLRYLTGNLQSLLEGARLGFESCTKSSDSNPAVMGAIALLYSKQQGKRIHDTFVFHPQLESLGKWYRQLLAESIGKEHDRAGRSVREGILPTVSVGSTDLHSMAQLYLGGPRQSFTTFLSAKAGTNPLMAAIREGTEHAYAKQVMPFFDVALDDISLRSLGEYMQWKMIETMCLGELLGVNTFDQPAVELYKAETRDILKKKN